MNVNVAARQEILAALVKSATVIPVLTVERLEHAVAACQGAGRRWRAHAGSDLRTPVAIEAAKAMISEVPDAIVGIGHDPEPGRS